MFYTMRLIYLLILFVLGTVCSQASPQTVQKKYIRYSEQFNNNKLSFNNQGMPTKADRLSNKEGNIILIYDESLSDSIKISLLAAKKLWEAKLPTVQPVFISVLFEPLGEDVSMIADVAYCGSEDMIGCPCALASQISNFPYGSIDSPDGCVVLNSDIDWNCRFSEDDTSDYNLPTMLLKGIARCLGFGSSIIEDRKDYFSYIEGWPSYFDKLLYYNNNALTDFEEGGAEMANFVKSNKVYAHTESQTYKIYAPDKFVQYRSLCYFDDKNSLMSYSLGKGAIDLTIDDKTLDVLRTIGWNLPQPGFSIKCDNISDDGIGSSYEQHTFTLLKGNANISNYSWKFFLKNKQGNYTLVSNGAGESFTITKILSPDNFFININGDLEGRIECDYSLNGVRHNAIPFTVSLELKPSIISIDNITAIDNGLYEFYLNFNVRYTGADYVSIEIEEEYNTTLRNYRFDEPYIAHVRTGNITNLYYSWVTVVVSNKYGTTSETMEYAPIYSRRKLRDISKRIMSDIPLNSQTISKIIIYNIDGSIIFQGTPSEFLNYNFNIGIYLKEEIFNNGSVKTSKILFR